MNVFKVALVTGTAGRPTAEIRDFDAGPLGLESAMEGADICFMAAPYSVGSWSPSPQRRSRRWRN